MVTCTIQSVKFLLLLVVNNFLVSISDAGPAVPSPAINTITEGSTTCPRQNRLSSHRIVGGQEVPIGSVPHQIQLRNFGQHVCGGSILDESWIITAAHCVYDYPVSDFMIVAGVHNIFNPAFDVQFRNVSVKIVHENFVVGTPDETPHTNDIALLRLSTPLILAPENRTKSIKLSTYSVESGTLATVTGWGDTSYNGFLSPVLLGLTIPIVSDEKCRNIHGQAEILDSMICAGFDQGGKDPCFGDSGGPLVVTVNGETQLVGIISWGIKCAQPGYPGVYTEIKYFIDWINSKLA